MNKNHKVELDIGDALLIATSKMTFCPETIWLCRREIRSYPS